MSEFVHQEEYCLNCKTTLQGEFCYRCGQKKLDTHNDSFLHMMTHFIGDFVHFDSQIFRTAIPLLFKPGFLVNEYLKGKRVRYLPPVRMYVFLSFLFFFLTFSLTDFTEEAGDKAKEGSILNFSIKDDSAGSSRNMSWNELSDTLVKFDEGDVTFGKEKFVNAQQYDSMQKTLAADKRDNWLSHRFKKKGLIFKEKITGKDRGVFFNEMIHNFFHNFPKVLFFLLPVFALLFKLLYRKRYYAEHFIFSIQFYNFFFLFGSIFLLIRMIPFFHHFGTVLYVLLPLLYLVLSMLYVYKQSKIKTLLKFGIFIITFSLLLVLGLSINMILTIFTV